MKIDYVTKAVAKDIMDVLKENKKPMSLPSLFTNSKIRAINTYRYCPKKGSTKYVLDDWDRAVDYLFNQGLIARYGLISWRLLNESEIDYMNNVKDYSK